MARYAIDAPTLLHLVSNDLRPDPSHQLVAPGWVRSQALDLLFAACGRGELTEADALERHERLTRLRMRLLNDRVSRRTAWQIAREQGWETIRDAEYLAIAKLQADALVTTDHAMRARADGIVPVEPVDVLL